jgi:hypothetical protein
MESCEAINFDSLKIPIPELIKQYPLEKQSEIAIIVRCL